MKQFEMFFDKRYVKQRVGRDKVSGNDLVQKVRPGLLSLVATAFLAAASSPATAETFVLTNGDIVEGTIVRAPAHMIEIKLYGSGLLRIPATDVQRVDLETEAGDIVSGQLADWSNGIYRLSTDRGPVRARVEDGVVVALTDEAKEDAGEQTADTSVDDATVATAPEAIAPPAQEPSSISSGINAGFVYVSPIDDGGHTFMLEKGRLQLSNNPLVEATVALTVGAEDEGQTRRAVDQLVSGGANLVFMTGHDSVAATTEAAKQHADVRFIHCGTFEPSANIDVLCGRIYQARYLTGIIAGSMTEAGLIGYVAAKPTPATLVDINAFTLGVQSTNPEAKVIVNWTNAWYAPGAAQRRARELVERGVDILTLHQDSPAALQIAEQQGISAIGFQSDMSAFAPSSALTSAVWNWGEMYDHIVDRLKDGEVNTRPTWLGLREGVVDIAPIAPQVPDEVRQLVEQRRREMIDGRFRVFTGPIRDVDGDIRILDGRTIADESFYAMDYLVEGVVGFKR